MSRDDEAKLSEPDREERLLSDLRDAAPAVPARGPVTRNNDQAIGAQAIAQSAPPTANAQGGAASAEEPIGKWLKFWQGVLHVDTSKMDLGIGFRNALGVALPLAAGIAIKMPLGGLAVASGALNVSYSDGHDPYWQRAKRMLATSALCAVAVMAGGLAGHHPVLAVSLTAFWAFWAGFAIAVSPTAESQGVISVVVLIIFAAQILTPERALQAGALAFGGGVLQMLFSILLWPVHAYDPERRALSNLYLTLGKAAADPAQLVRSSPPGVEASTAAQEALAGRVSDHSAIGERFRSLLNQAERTRLRLFTLGRLLRRMRREKFGFAPAEMVEHFLESISHVTIAIGESLRHNAPLKIDDAWLTAMHLETESLREAHESAE
jgi:hypothetical protein